MAKYKKRPDGRYATQIIIGRENDGKAVHKTIYGRTVKELDEKIALCRQEAKQHTINSHNPTLAEWAEIWLKTKSGSAYNTLMIYEGAINAHILPQIGEVRLKDIKVYHIQNLIDTQINIGHARTAQIVRGVIRQILDYALKNQIIAVNAASLTNHPKNKKSPRIALTQEQIKTILDVDMGLKQRTFFSLLLYTGLRRGEGLSLSVDNIDLKNKTVTVNKSLYFKVNTPVIKDMPKTVTGFRIIAMPDKLVDILSSYMPTLTSDILFPAERGGYMSQIAFRRFWDKIQAVAGVPNLTPHVCRHTYATMLYYAGVDIKTAQYLLGHASTRMTLDLYTHLDITNKGAQESRLNDYINKI